MEILAVFLEMADHPGGVLAFLCLVIYGTWHVSRKLATMQNAHTNLTAFSEDLREMLKEHIDYDKEQHRRLQTMIKERDHEAKEDRKHVHDRINQLDDKIDGKIAELQKELSYLKGKIEIFTGEKKQ